jgi:RNA polymerase sigma-70 factor (ECF subfamily)
MGGVVADPALLEVSGDRAGALAVELPIEVGADLPSDASMIATSHSLETHRAAATIPADRPVGECRNGSDHRRVPDLMNEPIRSSLDIEQAFSNYVVPEVEVLYRVALSISRNPADAEDLVQDTLLRAYRAIASFDGRHPRAWLLTILRNAQINRVRRQRPELLRDPDATMAVAVSTATTGRSPEDLVIGETFDAVVEAAFNELPDKFRQVVELVDLDGLSYREAAEVLGVPEGTIMSRLHRARTRIRRRLAIAGLAPRQGMLSRKATP